MFSYGILFVLLLAGVNCRYVLIEDPMFVSNEELEHLRVRRQAQAAVSLDNKGNWDLGGKVPIAGNDRNILSATGSAGLSPDHKLSSYGAGLALDNVNGHGLSLSAKQIPDFGKQLTAAGRVNLVNSGKHNLDANAFATRNLPSIPNVPNFSTVGGNLDYMYNNKLGASLGAARTDFLQRTDVSALGKANLFRDAGSSLDFTAGATRSFSPFIPKSSWEPTFGFTFGKSF